MYWYVYPILVIAAIIPIGLFVLSYMSNSGGPFVLACGILLVYCAIIRWVMAQMNTDI